MAKVKLSFQRPPKADATSLPAQDSHGGRGLRGGADSRGESGTGDVHPEQSKEDFSGAQSPSDSEKEGPEQPRKEPPLQRLLAEIGRGATVPAAAERAGIRPEIAELMVDYLERSGRLQSATSLCSSGLGACGTGTSDQVRIHCAGCPLSA